MVNATLDPAALIRKHLEEAEPDLSASTTSCRNSRSTNRYMGLEYLAKMTSTEETLALAIAG